MDEDTKSIPDREVGRKTEQDVATGTNQWTPKVLSHGRLGRDKPIKAEDGVANKMENQGRE